MKAKTVVYSAGRFFLFLLCLGLSCLNGWHIVKLWPPLDGHFETIHLALIPLLIAEYILISLAALCLVAFIKGGFSKLKKIKEGGPNLLFGLLVGLVFGLVFGFPLGLLVGLGVGPGGGFFFGFLAGLGVGLSGGFIAGFIAGLAREFA